MEPKVYRVLGMTCGGCARHVEKALKSVPGVVSVAMDVARGTATVAGEALYPELAASVTAAGYELAGPA